MYTTLSDDSQYDLLLPYDAISPRIADSGSLLEELLGNEIAMPPPEHFEQHVEKHFPECSSDTHLAMPSIFAAAFDLDAIEWAAALSALPFPPPGSPSSSSDDSIPTPLSPNSDTTFASDFSPSLTRDWLLDDPYDGGHNVGPAAAPAPMAIDVLDGFQFSFEHELQVYPSLSTPASPLSYNGYEQQPLQHDTRAAAAEAHSMGLRMESASPLPLSPSFVFPPQPSPTVLPSPKRAPNKRALSVDSDTDAPVRKKQARRRRRDVRQFACPVPGCDFVSGRNYNLKTHIATHEGKKTFACPHPGCTSALARQHDLDRHIISKHTNRGSPRKAGAKKAKAKVAHK